MRRRPARLLPALAAFGVVSFAAVVAPLASASDGVHAAGTFTGDSGHVTEGSVRIEREGDRYVIVLGEDFSFDGAPDPKVALGAGGFREDAVLAPLRANSGEQRYVAPAGLDVESFDEVWIWCEQYSVPLGHAELTSD